MIDALPRTVLPGAGVRFEIGDRRWVWMSVVERRDPIVVFHRHASVQVVVSDRVEEVQDRYTRLALLPQRQNFSGHPLPFADVVTVYGQGVDH
jgi:hypothetical protein